MNKKLIALAVAGASCVPAAWAQTANPVTLYGRVYVTAEWVESDSNESRTRIEDQSSLLGVRGTEDLGGGLKAFFQLETAFRPDQNNTTFAARNSGIGLQGGFGSVILGRWDMPFKSATIAVDPFGDLTLGGITGTLSDRGNFDRRDQNVLQYWSPNMGGFAFRLAATADETPDVRDFGANMTYSKGPLYAFLAWEQHDLANDAEEDAWAAGARFDFGPFRLGGQYQRIDKGNGVEMKNYMVNGVFTAGKNQFILQYMQSKDAPADCDSYHLGYQYNFTRRTFFLGQYSFIDNDPGANCNFGANRLTISAAAGEEVKGFSLGLRHVF